MRVALLAESFLPQTNGVVNSVLHVLHHLAREGHETLVIAPRGADRSVPDVLDGSKLALLRSVPLPSYPDVRVVFARAATLTRILRDFAPDVVHLASPFVVGWQGVIAADALRIPSVAVYQTDVIAYAERYGLPGAAPLAARHVARLHRRATLTLAPSTASAQQLATLGVDRVRPWARGVDGERFAPERRSEALRAQGAPRGEVLAGYVGRLAPEKQVDDLRVLRDLPGVRLVVIGDGPSRPRLQATLSDAVFTGFLDGDALATSIASLDVFVHPGESETFCQTVQEAHASGVPVVATGRGGPVDLVRSSVDGWLYTPGDLADLRARVADLAGDPAKRSAFSTAARGAVRERTWEALCRQLVGHYEDARSLRPIDDAMIARALERPSRPSSQRSAPRWRTYVALGDSITEGLSDSSRSPSGEFRGWADRLAELLASARGGRFRYANLAVRSRTVDGMLAEQVPRALSLRPELVSVLIGANDLVKRAADPAEVAAKVGDAVRTIRATGADVLLVTPFLPRRRAAALFAKRFAVFASHLRRIAREESAILLDLDTVPALGDLEMWAEDKVHLRSRGHRFLAYRAAEVLGVPYAEALGGLEAALHEDAVEPPDASGVDWVRWHALPWVWRRLRGKTAGDGLVAKHDGYTELGPTTRRQAAV